MTSGSDASVSEGKTPKWRAVPKWMRVVMALLVVIALAFGFSLLLSSQAIVGSVHKRNFHIVQIAANGLETWPREVAVMARSSIGLATKGGGEGPAEFRTLDRKRGPETAISTVHRHPDLGDFRIHYRRDCYIARRVYFASGKLAGEGTQYTVLDTFEDPQSPSGTACYIVSVPLNRLVDMRFENRDIHNFLITARDGRIVQQIGERRLPVLGIGKLGANDGLARGIAAKATGEPSQPAAPVGLDEVRNVAPVTISGTPYLAYVIPFAMPGAAGACPTAAEMRKEDGPSAGGGDCFAVALMPAQSLRRSWLSPPPVLIIGFGLGLAALLALLPLIRLLLIGGAEAISGIEVVGIILGLPAALTIATFGIMFAADVNSERGIAERETRQVSEYLAQRAGREIEDTLGAMLRRGAIGERLAAASGSCARGGPLATCADDYGTSGLNLELLLFVGADGKILADDPARTSYAYRLQFPTGFDVSARDYFSRLQRGEGLPLPEMGEAASAPCAARNGAARFMIDQIRSQTDGYDKTVLAVPCPDTSDEAAGDGGVLPADDPVALAIVTLKSFLSPVLPSPVRFLVIDGSKPDFPVLFHQSRGHAGLESFADQADLTALEADRLRETSSDPEAVPFPFRARYEGERTIFTATRVKHTPWLVLAWERTDDADGIAARTATRAMLSWIAIALLFLVACIAALAATGKAWRQFWPHESAKGAYLHLGRVLGTAAMALLAKLLVGPLLAAGVLAGMALSVMIDGLRGERTATERAVGQRLVAALQQTLPERSGWQWYSQLFLAIVLLLFVASLLFVDWPLASALMLWVAAPTYAAWRLEAPRDSDEPLTPATERAYLSACLAFLACIALAPSIALWQDGRALSHQLADGSRLSAAAEALAAHDGKAAAIRRALFLAPAEPGTATLGALLALSGQRKDGTLEERRPEAAGFSTALWALQMGVSFKAPASCRLPDPRQGLDGWLCRGRDSVGLPVLGVAPRRIDRSATILFGFGLVAAAALLLVFAFQAVARTLDALAGFGVPLGAVRGRRVRLPANAVEGGWRKVEETAEGKAKECEGLPPRTLLVAPQQVVRDRLAGYPEAWTVDLAEMLLDRSGTDLMEANIRKTFAPARRDGAEGPPALLIAWGLELLLRDIPRRQAALRFLEMADQKLASGALTGIVVIAEMSPLERILDAFESGGTADESTRTIREELRWARLFQTFETIIFAPIDKIGHKQFPDDISKPVWRLIAELRWLPSVVIDGTTGGSRTRLLGQGVGDIFPLTAEYYQVSYNKEILRWAEAVNPCSEEAAIDHLRSTLIEHYEQCWVASTLAERLVLDAVARGHFVNMRQALPLQSLVRRGLVVLDPSPRLMSQSFARFVLQAERPDTLADWRSKQPRSGWMSARIPLLLAIPVGIIAITLAAAESGQELTAIFSVLVAGAPALLSALFRSVRPA